jgi:hypothetical protein
MNESNAQTFRRQCRLFSRLVMAVELRTDPFGEQLPAPKRVSSFAEALLVCPTEDAILTHIGRDRESAELCRGYANDMATGFDIESAAAGLERSMHETPLYLLASVLVRRARLSAEQMDEKWKPNP